VVKCQGISDSQDGKFQVTTLQNSSGLYFETMGPLRVSFTSWDFVTYLNMTTYHLKYQLLQNIHNQTVEMCIQLKKRQDSILTNTCTDLMKSTTPFVQEIESNFNSVLRILGLNNGNSEHLNRKPRGLMNAVGRLANVLFVVCSVQDSEFFYKNIVNLARPEDKYVHLSQKLVRIVSAVANNDNYIMQENINEIKKQFGRSAATINVLEIQTTFLEHIAVLTVFLKQFSFETQNLMSIVNSA